MSGSSIRGSAAIVGAALAGLGGAPGRSSEEIAIEASVKALAEAGLTTRCSARCPAIRTRCRAC